MYDLLKYGDLQTAAVATGNGTALRVTSPQDGSFSSSAIQVTIAGTATITFEGTVGQSDTQASNTWVSLVARNRATGATATTATASGIYDLDVSGLAFIRARISSWSSGAVTATHLTTKREIETPVLSTGVLGTVIVSSAADMRESWRVSTLSFTTTNDSDNTFTVPATTEYQILSIYVTLASTATAGNRQMVVLATNTSDVTLAEFVAGATQAANLTYRYQFGPGCNDLTAVRDNTYLSVAMAPLFLGAGDKLRIYDKTAVDAAADDMTIKIQIASRSIA